MFRRLKLVARSQQFTHFGHGVSTQSPRRKLVQSVQKSHQRSISPRIRCKFSVRGEYINTLTSMRRFAFLPSSVSLGNAGRFSPYAAGLISGDVPSPSERPSSLGEILYIK